VDSENLEQQIIKNFVEKNPDKFNDLIPELMKSLQTEKQEDEKKRDVPEKNEPVLAYGEDNLFIRFQCDEMHIT